MDGSRYILLSIFEPKNAKSHLVGQTSVEVESKFFSSSVD